MGQLRKRMEADLKLAGYSPQAQKIYLLYARRFARHFMGSPEELGEFFLACNAGGPNTARAPGRDRC